MGKKLNWEVFGYKSLHVLDNVLLLINKRGEKPRIQWGKTELIYINTTAKNFKIKIVLDILTVQYFGRKPKSYGTVYKKLLLKIINKMIKICAYLATKYFQV